MVSFGRLPRADHALEHGDAPMEPSTLAAYLDALERLNAWFGGYRLSIRAVESLARRAPPRSLVVADVGGSRGDLAVRLARRARRQGRPLTVVVVDRDEASLVLGQRMAKPLDEIHWVQADAAALPFRPGAVDVAVMALTLHHLEPDAAVASLAALRRVARLGVVVNDLLRSRFAYGLVRLASALFTRHPAARADGPLSVRRAYTRAEVQDLARRAGFRRAAVRTHPVFARLVAVLT